MNEGTEILYATGLVLMVIFGFMFVTTLSQFPICGVNGDEVCHVKYAPLFGFATAIGLVLVLIGLVYEDKLNKLNRA